jgi:hypothetical protein
MKKKLITLLLSVISLSLAALALAQISLPNPLDPINNFTSLICNIAVYIFGFIGALATIMFVWAGILYLTSGANPGNAQKANKAVLYAIIGLAIALAGEGLIVFVSQVIGANAAGLC